MSFADDIKAFKEKALLEVNNKSCQVYETLATVAISRTPTLGYGAYAEGYLKNQWNSTVNGINTSQNGVVDPSGSASLVSVVSATTQKPFLGKDAFITLSNSVSYAYRADKLGWPAGQSAAGWIWANNIPAYNMTEFAIGFTKRTWL